MSRKAKCPGKQNVLGTNVHRAKCPGGQNVLGTNVHRAKCPGGQIYLVQLFERPDALGQMSGVQMSGGQMSDSEMSGDRTPSSSGHRPSGAGSETKAGL